MMKNLEEVRKEIEKNHLSILTSEGRHLIGIAAGAASILENDCSSEDKLSDEEKHKFFKMLLDALSKHDELITWSIKELQNIIDEMEEQNKSEREELAQRIENEFAEVPYPGDQNIGVREIEDFIGQKEWQNIPLEVLAHNRTALLMFSPEAYHFYLPAFLCAVLRHPEMEYLEDPTLYKLIPSDSDARNPEEAIPLFKKGEKLLIVEFLEKHGELFPQSSYTLLEENVVTLQRAIQFWRKYL